MARTPAYADKLKILLIGKTGSGKSSIGNSILGRNEFASSSSLSSVTTEMKIAWSEDDGIAVVDGPGLEDTNLSQVEDKKAACTNMAVALLLCNGSVDVFLFTIMFGTRWTKEERAVVSSLKTIFGDTFLTDRTIIAVTGGDQFAKRMKKDGTPNKSFTSWWQEQNDDLFKTCSPRIVLFDNDAESEEDKTRQRNELLQHAQKIREEKGPYTNEMFQTYKKLREEIAKENPMFTEEIQKDINILSADLAVLAKNPTLQSAENLEKRLDEVMKKTSNIPRTDATLKCIQDLEEMKKIVHDLKDSVKVNDLAQMTAHIDTLKKQNDDLQKGHNTSLLEAFGVVLKVFLLCFGPVSSMSEALLNTAKTYIQKKTQHFGNK